MNKVCRRVAMTGPVLLLVFLGACRADIAKPDDVGVSPSRAVTPDAAIGLDALPVTPVDGSSGDNRLTIDALPPIDGPLARPDVGRETSNGTCNFGQMVPRKATPEVMLVVDRSNSTRRNAAGSMETRWNEVSAGVNEAVKSTQVDVSWGLKLYPTTAACDVAEGVDVPVAASSYNAMNARLTATQPSAGADGAPLYVAVRKAAALLTSTLSRNPRFLVLSFDSVLGCPGGAPGEKEAIKAVTDVSALGTHTFVLGSATAGTPEHTLLNALAVGGLEPNPGMTKYFLANNRAQTQTALEEIAKRVKSCVFMTDAQAPAPDYVALEVNGQRIPRDKTQADGWNWNGNNFQVMEVFGPSCDRLKANVAPDVQIIYGCDGIAP